MSHVVPEQWNKYASLPDVLIQSTEEYGDKAGFRFRTSDDEVASYSFTELYDKVSVFAKALELLHLTHKHIALFSENRIEWLIADLALLGLGGVDVPRGTDSTADELRYILKHSDSEAVIVENEATYRKIASHVKGGKTVIVLDDSLDNPSHHIYSFSSIMALGEKALGKESQPRHYYRKQAAHVDREDLATIIYTSGTTGHPKGVMLSHGNILHNVEVVPPIVQLSHEDVFLSVLPIWHVYERMICYTAMACGSLSFYSNKRQIKRDLSFVKPTVFITVPAIWLNIYNGVMNSIERKSGISKRLALFLIEQSVTYTRYLRAKNDELLLYGDDTSEKHLAETTPGPLAGLYHALAKKIVYKNILALTGGNLRITVSGGGALPLFVEDFVEACGINLLVGWGITETAPVVSLRPIHDNIKGTCGKPIPLVDVEIRNEKGEVVPDGEKGLCFIKGPNVMKGYYKERKRTHEAIVDGWFNSGDIGTYTNNGDIVLTGRAKETIVLLNGENIEPAPIEHKLLESRYINQVIIVGQDRKHLGALIYPEVEQVSAYLKKKGVAFTEDDVFTLKETRDLLEEVIRKSITTDNGFKDFERIVRFTCIKEPFTTENGLLTQSLKMRRNEISEYYAETIESLYR